MERPLLPGIVEIDAARGAIAGSGRVEQASRRLTVAQQTALEGKLIVESGDPPVSVDGGSGLGRVSDLDRARIGNEPQKIEDRGIAGIEAIVDSGRLDAPIQLDNDGIGVQRLELQEVGGLGSTKALEEVRPGTESRRARRPLFNPGHADLSSLSEAVRHSGTLNRTVARIHPEFFEADKDSAGLSDRAGDEGNRAHLVVDRIVHPQAHRLVVHANLLAILDDLVRVQIVGPRTAVALNGHRSRRALHRAPHGAELEVAYLVSEHCSFQRLAEAGEHVRIEQVAVDIAQVCAETVVLVVEAHPLPLRVAKTVVAQLHVEVEHAQNVSARHLRLPDVRKVIRALAVVVEAVESIPIAIHLLDVVTERSLSVDLDSAQELVMQPRRSARASADGGLRIR